jgi:hypothetical protein
MASEHPDASGTAALLPYCYAGVAICATGWQCGNYASLKNSTALPAQMRALSSSGTSA